MKRTIKNNIEWQRYNLVGANRKLKNISSDLNQSKISSTLISQKIVWKFNPPSSPWIGGYWESFVKVTMRYLTIFYYKRKAKQRPSNTSRKWLKFAQIQDIFFRINYRIRRRRCWKVCRAKDSNKIKAYEEKVISTSA